MLAGPLENAVTNAQFSGLGHDGRSVGHTAQAAPPRHQRQTDLAQVVLEDGLVLAGHDKADLRGQARRGAPRVRVGARVMTKPASVARRVRM